MLTSAPNLVLKPAIVQTKVRIADKEDAHWKLRPPRWIAEHNGLFWDVTHYDGVCANYGVVAHQNRPDDHRSRPDSNPVPDAWHRPLRVPKARASLVSTDCDTLQNLAAVADYGAVTYDYAHRMSEAQSPTNTRLRANVDTNRNVLPLKDGRK
jgi:hypothetical protein